MAVRNCAEIGENLINIVNRLMTNDDLVKLLYYTDKDPLNVDHPNLTQAEKSTKIFEKLIKIVPRVGPDDTSNSILVLRVMDGIKLLDNKEFKRITVNIQIYVPLTQWIIKNTNLRPFAIMGEIQKSLAGKRINGIGVIDGGNFELHFLTEEMSCYDMEFSITSYD